MEVCAAGKWQAAALHEVIDHIVERHHAYLRRELPALETLVHQAGKGRGRSEGPDPLEKLFRYFRRELENHLRREEEVLFPLIRKIEAAQAAGLEPPRFPFGPITNPIGILEHDHDAERKQLAAMREILGKRAGPDPGGLLERIEEMEADTGLHIDLEDGILFPRAAALGEPSC